MNPSPVPAPTGVQSAPSLRFDVVAGLTAAAVVLPKAMAYATVAGLRALERPEAVAARRGLPLEEVAPAALLRAQAAGKAAQAAEVGA